MEMRRLIGLCGKKRAGKNTFADMLSELHPYQQISFADALWDVLLATNPYVGIDHTRVNDLVVAIGKERAKIEFPEVRRLLQDLGTNGVRNVIGPDTWLNLVSQKIVQNSDTSYAVTDLRFENEAQMVKDLGGIVVKLDRPRTGFELQDQHPSETSVDLIIPDVFVVNNQGLDNLREEAYLINLFAGSR